jgi:flagellar protein FlaI
VEQIELNTANAEMLAYFWYLAEHGASMLVVGGVATGKTSLLNTIAMFIPPEAKIVSIEDTREIRIPHQHWIAGIARSGFGLPLPSGDKYGEVTLFDLLKESFRQNPDYVIVGEVRGKETYVMFQGISSGHPSISTFHAGSVETVIKRLTTPPIELSPSLVESLDLICVMTHAKEKGKSARRIKEISEIISVDPKTSEVKTNIVFRWDPATDTYHKLNDSIKLEKFALARGGTFHDAMEEIDRRVKILNWLQQNGIKDHKKIAEYINMYYKEPQKLMVMVGAPLKAGEKIQSPVQVSGAEKQQPSQRRNSILDLLGFKIFREK